MLRQEKDLPAIRQNASRDAIVSRRACHDIVKKPLPKGKVLFPRVLPDIVSSHDELGAALRFNSIATPEENFAGRLLTSAKNVG